MAKLNWSLINYYDGTICLINNKDKSTLNFNKEQIKDIIELLQDVQND